VCDNLNEVDIPLDSTVDDAALEDRDGDDIIRRLVAAE
jgi:hypothetical protein